MGATFLSRSAVVIRWYVWLVALTPAALGICVLGLGLGDFRSSGAVAGVGLSIGAVAVLLLLRGRWRSAHGVRRLLGLTSVAALGVVGVLGLLVGVPEFLQVRFGWFVASDAYGLRAIVAVDDAFVAVGDGRRGAVVLRSTDGRAWQRAPVPPALDGVGMRDALVTADGLIAVGSAAGDDATQVVTSRDGVQWRPTARMGHDVFGVTPVALAGTGERVVAVGSIYGNDAVFFDSVDGRAWSGVPPEPVFDDGEDPTDVACDAVRCVAVGERYNAGGLLGGDKRRGIAWSTVAGEPWVQSDGVFGHAVVTGVTASGDGFVAVGYDEPSDRAAVWTSQNGRGWTSVSNDRAFHDARMDGVVTIDGMVTAFGRHGDAIVVWTRIATGAWERATVDATVQPGSRIRAIASNGATVAAVGVDAADGSPAIWTSVDRVRWERMT